MRPRQQWTLRRRRSDRLWWTLVLSAGAVVIAALVVRNLSSSGGASEPEARPAEASSSVASNECAVASGCPPRPTAECVGSDCAPLDGAVPESNDASPPGDDFVVASEVPPPKITGQAAAVIEQSCGALLYGHRADKRLPPASLTKIATALVAVERARLSDIVDVRVNGALMSASTRSSVMGLEPGQQLPLRDLLYGLLLPSGNDAAIAIAEHVGGGLPAFVALMNGKVQELGLRNTHFANPHGLDEPGLYTSAYDIAVLGRELMANRELAAIVASKTYQPSWDGPPLWNGNKLLYEYPGSRGVKTGYTVGAAQTLVAAAERNGRTIVVSVLASWDRYTDAIALFEWAFAKTTPPCFR